MTIFCVHTKYDQRIEMAKEIRLACSMPYVINEKKKEKMKNNNECITCDPSIKDASGQQINYHF